MISWVRISTLGWKAQQKRFSRIASRSDCSIFIRASASRSMLLSKNAVEPFPFVLTRSLACRALTVDLVAVQCDVGVLAHRLVAPAMHRREADADRGRGEDRGFRDEER